MQFDTYNMPGRGLRPLTLKSTVFNRVGATAVVLGQVVMTDAKGVNAAVSKTQTNSGASDYWANNVVTPTTAGIGVASVDSGYWFGVVTGLGTAGTGANNTEIEVTWQGRVNVLITTGAGSAEFGKLLFPANAQTGVTTTPVALIKALGRCEVDVTNTAGVTTYPCLWSGIDGFGNEPAS